MALESIMLNGKSQSGKDKYLMISFVFGIQETKQTNKERKRQTKNQTLNYREQSYQMGGRWRMGEICDGI